MGTNLNDLNHNTVGPRFSDIFGGKVFLSLIRGVTKSGSNATNFSYRGKFIMSLNRGVTKSGVTKSGSDCSSDSGSTFACAV